MSAERVQKILAQAGISSRRKAEDLIRDGLVTINGKVAQLGDKAEWGKDAIKVKGKLLQQAEAPIYIALHKPKGVISAMVDPDGRATLKEFLGKVHARVFPVGRLDFNSDGLILLTNDGAFAARLQKCDEVARVYQVKVKGHIDDEMLARVQRGAWVEKPVGDGTFKAKKKLKPHLAWIESKLQSKTQINVVIMGGGAFDIKQLFDTTGFLVEKITRTAIGHITLHGLEPGKYRLMKASQMEALITQPELGTRELPTENPKPRPTEAIAPKPLSQRSPIRPAGRSGHTPIRPAGRPERGGGRSSERSPIRPAGRPTGPTGFMAGRSSERSPIRPAKDAGFSDRGRFSRDRSDERSSERSPIRPAKSSGANWGEDSDHKPVRRSAGKFGDKSDSKFVGKSAGKVGGKVGGYATIRPEKYDSEYSERPTRSTSRATPRAEAGTRDKRSTGRSSETSAPRSSFRGSTRAPKKRSE